MTCTSASASWLPKKTLGPPILVSLLACPSNSKLLLRSRRPLVENSAPLLLVKTLPPEGETPGVKRATMSKPLPIGRFATFWVSKVSLTWMESGCSNAVAPSTVTASELPIFNVWTPKRSLPAGAHAHSLYVDRDKPRRLDGDGIRPGRHARNLKASGIIADGLERSICAVLGRRHRCAHNHGRAWIFHRSADGAGDDALRKAWQAARQEKPKQSGSQEHACESPSSFPPHSCEMH